jgi:hypothetical protein
MRFYRLSLVAMACCGGKTPDAVVVAPATSVPATQASAPTSVATTAPTPLTSAPAFRCPSEAVRKAVLDCPPASGAAPRYVDFIDARSRLATDQTKTHQRAPTKTTKDFTPRAFTPLQQKLVDVAKAYRCQGSSKGDPSQLEDVSYELGRTYFETQHWEEAAAIFHVVAMEKADVSEYAAQLALESMNVLASQLHRAECSEELGPRVTLYRQHLCGSPPIGSSETCTTLTKIEAEIAKGAKP